MRLLRTVASIPKFQLFDFSHVSARLAIFWVKLLLPVSPLPRIVMPGTNDEKLE